VNGVIGAAGVVAILLVVGTGLGLLDRKGFSFRWLLIAAGLVVLNDLMLTSGYRQIPRLIDGDWNWQGKLLALATTLVVASVPAFGWRRAGLALVQRREGLTLTLFVALVMFAVFAGLALLMPDQPFDGETFAFQAAMPGLEEEPFYTGILLLALNEAFKGRVRFLGADWGWAALLVAMLFGLAHAFGYSNGGFSFDPLAMLLTGGPAPLVYWLRQRSGSVLLPVLLHNTANTMPLLL
jgi:hypothetical protein